MNEELQKHIEEKLELSNSLDIDLKKIKTTIENIGSLQEQLQELKEEKKRAYFKDCLKRLKNDFQNDYDIIPKDSSFETNEFSLSVFLPLEDNKKIEIAIEEDGNDQLFYGIGASGPKNKQIRDFIKPITKDFDGENEYWYASKPVHFEKGYNEIKSLIKDIEKQLSSSQN